MNLVITEAGKQALVNATQTGTAQLILAEIAVGSGQYTPDATQTALYDEIKRLPIIQASAVEDHVIHVAYQDDSTDSYDVYEVGVYTSDGVLFAVYSSNELLISKSANTTCLLTVDMIIDDLDVSDISFGDIEFATGAATTESAGIVEIATQAEVDAGEDAYRVVTPKTLAASFATRFAASFATAFNSAFVSEFEPAFNAAFADAFPTAFDSQFEHDFDNAFNSAWDASFNSSFTNAFDDAFNDAFNDDFPGAFSAAFSDTFPTQFSTAFQARMAPKSATLTGTSGSYAVTPAGLNYAITNMTWNIGKARVQAASTTALRSLSDRFADIANPLNFGAVGDGSANDTNAFTALENVYSNQMVDLLGKRYRVSTSPTGNTYYNGKFVVAGKDLDPIAVNLSDSRIINAKGKPNASFYPSGLNRIYQANNGTNQLAMARFSDDEHGNSLVFVKSRGGNVNTSKSAVAGDLIAQVNFLADTGNVDYTNGTLQGTSAAQIKVVVYESSTLTPSGTNNAGVRGAIRITCCDDTNTREGTGIEILNNSLRPTDDNLLNLGTGARRWKAIYAMTDVISTSDAREKHDIEDIPEKVLDAWEKVNFKQFKFKSISETFFGVIAQEVIKAFESEGLNAHDYGIIDISDHGEGERYSMRYRDCYALEAACMRRKLARIEAMLKEVKDV